MKSEIVQWSTGESVTNHVCRELCSASLHRLLDHSSLFSQPKGTSGNYVDRKGIPRDLSKGVFFIVLVATFDLKTRFWNVFRRNASRPKG